MPSREYFLPGLPPKCICNAISHIQVKTYAFLLKYLHAMDENVAHPVPCPESSSTPSHMHMSSVKIIIGVSPNELTHWTTLQYLFNFIKSRVFLWVKNFRGLIASFARLLTLSQTFIVRYICLTKNKIWVFHPEGRFAPSCFMQTHVIYYYYCFTPVSLNFRRCPNFRAHYTFTKNGE